MRDSTVRRVSKGPLGKTNYVLESLIVLVKELGQAVGPLTGLLLTHSVGMVTVAWIDKSWVPGQN